MVTLKHYNMGIKSFIENWKKGRLERAEARKRLEELFETFLLDTKPLTPKASKHPGAALYRHAWKRAIARLAAKKYSQVAPQNLYGPVSLKMTPDAMLKLIEQEKRMLLADISDRTFSEKFDMQV